MLNLRVQGDTPMCLIVKRQDGPMAICIDATIPTLTTVESTMLYPPAQPDPNILWQCQIDGGTMPIILVVDDSLSVRKVAERMLKEAGLEVALAANGEEALAWLSANTPNLVIADVIMPDKSGFEVCAFLRAQASLTNTPVLLISGFVDDEVTRQAEACRADGVIKKPFQGASLRERVLDLLSARKEQEAPAAASAPELVLEMPALAPEPELTLPVAPPAS